jgi:exodeoxyribonuclease V beta subunit
VKALQPLDVPLTGVQLIEASAGAGKTFAITTLALRGIVEQELAPSRILVVTFTNAATAELRGRLRDRLHRAWQALADPGAVPHDPDLTTYACRRIDQGQAAADRTRLRAALDGFDEAAVFTIHGFCQRTLRELAFESGAAFDTELLGDPRPLLLEAVHDYWSRRLYDAPASTVAGLRDHGVTVESLATVAGAFAQHRELLVQDPAPADDDEVAQFARALVRDVGPAVLRTLAARKAAANTQDFDDLLHQVDAALRGPQGDGLAAAIRQRYPLALIDEFQDTDPVQYRIFQRVYAQPPAALFLIGDPKQAIYSFRGADVFAYIEAQRDAAAGHTLPTNWRSAPRLVDAVNTLFTVSPDAFALDEVCFRPAEPAPRSRDRLSGAGAGAPLRILFAERATHGTSATRQHNKRFDGGHWMPRAVADRIVELLDGSTSLDGRAVGAGDIAVLCRTNEQLHIMHAALRAAGVPSVVLGDASVFEAPEAAMLERVLRALAEPSDANAIRVALATPLLGLNGAELATLANDEPAWEGWVERFQFWGERWRTAGFTAAVRGLLDAQGVAPRLLAQPGGERSLTNLFHLCELAQQAVSEGRRGPRNVVEWLARMRTDQTLRTELGSEAAQVRLESDAHAVKLNTVHRAKGLEYPIVVLPFAWHFVRGDRDKVFPRFHAAPDHRLTIDLGLPAAADSEAQRAAEAAAEDMRLLYVATTRAEQLCLAVWGPFTDSERSALGTLLHRVPRRQGDAPARHSKAIGALVDGDLQADLDALVAAADGAIAVEPLVESRGRRHVAPADGRDALIEPPQVSPILQSWRIGSFTSLSAGAEGLGLRASEGIDRDEQAAAEAAPDDSVAARLTGFPRGRGPGTLVHRILELVDFTEPDATALRALVGEQLAVFGVGREWTEPLTGALFDVLATPLLPGTTPLRLRDVPRAYRLDEMEFAYPVAPDGGALTPHALAAAFARHGGTAELTAYAERLRQLPFRPLSGFLRGYIDCVFAHDGRWYVVDYKSNDLGAASARYAPAALAAEMVRHDYLLQAHLYVLAVHRYLRHRLPSYDYARDFGGVLYLFVRGMAPARGPATGIFHARPAAGLVDALDRLLAGAAGGAGR